MKLVATKTVSLTELSELCTHFYERKSIGTTYEAWLQSAQKELGIEDSGKHIISNDYFTVEASSAVLEKSYRTVI